MIQVSPQSAERPGADAHPRVWGLSVDELHTAFWRGRGAQCVRLGDVVPMERGAEVFLLLGADQLVMFNLAPVAERIAWHDTAVVRLRLVDPLDQDYMERVCLDGDGHVERIERSYRTPMIEQRVGITTSRRAARAWMNAASAREAWQQFRRQYSAERIDHLKRKGLVSSRLDGPGCQAMLNELVKRWKRPDLVIEGLQQIEGGVWSRMGDPPRNGDVRVGPIWIGDTDGTDETTAGMMFGPECVSDRASATPEPPLAIRSIVEIESASERGRADGVAAAKLGRIAKRAMDFMLAGVGLLILWPLFCIVAMAIIIEDGRPVFFGHRRQGRRGRNFTCWKFRTMYRNAEELAAQYREQNVCDGPQVLIADDPRVTRVGALLRRTQIDELPQLYNVLRGNMSLVGPRPSPENENQFCPAWREARLSVRPGITGLWQIKRTREPGEDFQEWIRYDLEYVRRASLMLDIRILLKTVLLVIMRRSSDANDQTR